MKFLKISVMKQKISPSRLKSLRNSKLKNIANASTVPVLFLFWILYSSLRKPNIPIMDDYDAILDFLIKWQEPNTKFALLLGPHNEHPMVIPRLIVLSQFKLFGTVDFRILTAVSQSMLIVLALVILQIQAKIQNRKSYNLIYLSILNLGLGTVLIWPMAGLQHITTVLFSAITFFLFSAKQSRLSFIKWVALYATAFTGGASLLILIILLLSQIFLKGPNLKWLLIHSFIILSIYLRFVRAPIPQDLDFDKSIILFLHFLGNPFSQFHGELFGLVLFIIILLNFKKFFKARQLIFIQLLLFNASMGLGVAISRNSMGTVYGGEEKYFLYSVMCWLIVLMVLSRSTFKSINMDFLAYPIAVIIFTITVQAKYPPISNLLKIHSVVYPMELEANALRILQESARLSVYNGNGKINGFH